MDKFYIITNHLKDPQLETTNVIKNYLEEKGKVCYVQDSGEPENGRPYKYTDASRIPPDVECVLVLGGDGTLLQASRDLVDTSLPLLGINMGTLGYLAEIELSDENESFEKPAWLGAEVSGDVRYYNSNLASHPYSEWKNDAHAPQDAQ